MSDTLADPLAPKTADSFDRLRADCGLIPVPDLCVFELRGEDRKGWLQGQATNDLKQLDMGASSSFCLCAPTGQMLAVCDIWGLRDRFVITCERVARDAVLRRVEQMVVLEDVQIQDVTGAYQLFSVQGPNATRRLQGIVSLPTLDAADGEGAVVTLRSNRTGSGGWDVLIPVGNRKLISSVRDLAPETLPEAYEIARLEAGIPRAGLDWDSKTMPPELGPAFGARHVSYKKGCYTGQEVLMRIHSRGHTNRSWVALLADRPISAGAGLSHSRRKDAGVVTSAAYSPDYGYFAGAMVRNEVVLEGELLTVESPTGSFSAEMRTMPVLRFG